MSDRCKGGGRERVTSDGGGGREGSVPRVWREERWDVGWGKGGFCTTGVAGGTWDFGWGKVGVCTSATTGGKWGGGR